MELSNNENLFLSNIGIGKENAVKAKYIPINARGIRRIVNGLRIKGYKICSGNNGYWLAKNKKEVESTIKILNSYKLRIEEVINSLRNEEVPEEIDGQISIFGGNQ